MWCNLNFPMKLFIFTTCTFLVLLITTGVSVPGQTAVRTNIAPAADSASAKADNRPAEVLFDEVNTYVDKKFEEFNKRKTAYDPGLETKTRQEQKELAIKYAAVLKTRTLEGHNLYHLGMLHHIGGRSEERRVGKERRYRRVRSEKRKNKLNEGN